MSKYYTGIGSRSTPKTIIPRIEEITKKYALNGYALRSGNADGADTFFYENHIKYSDKYEIYLPWPKFNKIQNPLFISLDNIDKKLLFEAEDIVSVIHPSWGRCTQGVRKLHIRNVFQVLGQDLKTPSETVFCWTENGEVKGGTATAIKIAKQYKIPVVNLGK